MKELNDVSRIKGLPITSEVIDVLNNAKYFNYIVQLINPKGVKDAWMWLNILEGVFVHFNATGLAIIYQADHDVYQLFQIASEANRNPYAYTIIGESVFTNINKEDGTEEYENVILTKRAKFVPAGQYAPDKYCTPDELLGIKELFNSWVELPVSTLIFEDPDQLSITTSMIRYNKTQKT
jgi:hypothetical protein